MTAAVGGSSRRGAVGALIAAALTTITAPLMAVAAPGGSGTSDAPAPAANGAPVSAASGAPVSAIAAAPAPSKKDAYLAAKKDPPRRRPSKLKPPRPGKPPAPVVSVFNTHTHEWLVVDRDPRASLPAPPQVDRFLRCHFTNQSTAMRDELIATLREAASHFSARRIDIVSGYRSPKYNLMLRKKGHEVAKDSQHTQGHAVDFRIPGIDVRTLESWALGRHKGGVGLYLESKFIHVDVGPFRRWNGT